MKTPLFTLLVPSVLAVGNFKPSSAPVAISPPTRLSEPSNPSSDCTVVQSKCKAKVATALSTCIDTLTKKAKYGSDFVDRFCKDPAELSTDDASCYCGKDPIMCGERYWSIFLDSTHRSSTFPWNYGVQWCNRAIPSCSCPDGEPQCEVPCASANLWKYPDSAVQLKSNVILDADIVDLHKCIKAIDPSCA